MYEGTEIRCEKPVDWFLVHFSKSVSDSNERIRSEFSKTLMWRIGSGDDAEGEQIDNTCVVFEKNGLNFGCAERSDK